ncbi:MAG: MFS transporter, partial [Nocardioides sp.]|nr:MFS transporter [Nocardioides sp.]
MAGVAFLPFSLGIFAISRVTPELLARFGARTMILVGSAALAAGYAWLSTIGTTDSYLAAVFGPMVIAGLATGLVFMPITATVLGGVEPEHAGSASGLLQTTQQLGSAVGVAAIVSVYAAGAVPGELVPGLQPAFLTSAAFAALATVVGLVGLPARAPRPVEIADEEVEAVAAEAA